MKMLLMASVVTREMALRLTHMSVHTLGPEWPRVLNKGPQPGTCLPAASSVEPKDAGLL